MTTGEKEIIDADNQRKEAQAIVRKVYEHDSFVKGYFSSTTLKTNVDAGVGTVTIATFTFPYNIAILEMKYVVKAIHENDILDVCVGSTMMLGSIQADVAVDDTAVTIEDAHIPLTDIGKKLILSDGTNMEGHTIISIDS